MLGQLFIEVQRLETDVIVGLLTAPEVWGWSEGRRAQKEEKFVRLMFVTRGNVFYSPII